MDQFPLALLQQKDEKNYSWTLSKNGVWNGSNFPSIKKKNAVALLTIVKAVDCSFYSNLPDIMVLGQFIV